MVEFTFGPVDLIAAAVDGEDLDPSVLDALADLVAAGHVRVLDLLAVTRAAGGELVFRDLDASTPAYANLADIEVAALGLISQDDAESLVRDLPVGCSAVVVAIELTWAITLASRLAQTGGVVLESVRIPAPVVNAVLETARQA